MQYLTQKLLGICYNKEFNFFEKISIYVIIKKNICSSITRRKSVKTSVHFFGSISTNVTTSRIPR